MKYRAILSSIALVAAIAAGQYTREFQSPDLGTNPYGGSYGFDVDGDGAPNLWTRSSSGQVVIYNSSLAAWWTVSFPSYPYSYLATPRDVDGDGLVEPVNMDGDAAGEVVFSGAEYTTDGYSGRVRVYDATTRQLEWESPVIAGFNGFANVDDVDGDGKHEVIITRSDYASYGYVEVYGYTGAGVDGAPRYELESRHGLARPTVGTGQTGIKFALSAGCHGRLVIRDRNGRAVRRMLEEDLPAGEYDVRWDGTDDAGRAVPAGVYLYELDFPGTARGGQLVIVR
ncbi:MAG: hypothetical protein JSU73_01520 [candidate division WOR-3 bacterium]|nr:MAG: hypothetical protein JSU73_01520 [candidate division WOR-3 bacterium]